jgi:hypothetical protein
VDGRKKEHCGLVSVSLMVTDMERRNPVVSS